MNKKIQSKPKAKVQKKPPIKTRKKPTSKQLPVADCTKLNPCTDIEYCDCTDNTQLLLAYAIHENPLRCYECNKTVSVEALGLEQALVDDLAAWNKVYSGIYNLWVDAGEYESWAKQALADPNGQVNTVGIKLAEKLSDYLPTYYWWWQDPDEEEYLTCPVCDGTLDFDDTHGTGKCAACFVLV